MRSIDQLDLFANDKLNLVNTLMPCSDDSPGLLLSENNNTDEVTPETANPQTNDPTRTERTQSLKSPLSPDI